MRVARNPMPHHHYKNMAAPDAGKISNIFSPNHSGLQVGASYGDIKYYPGQYQDSKPAGPFARIPFSRDPEFIERGTTLDEVAQLSKQPAARVALVGLGGVGKSQLAVEHAHRVHAAFPEKYVFWIHAATTARFKESYRHIARTLGLIAPDNSGPQENVMEVLLRWLENPEKGSWVMVVDNADDIDMFHTSETASPEAKLLDDYLPQSHHGRILITSRNRQVADRLVGKSRNIIMIGPMDERESFALFKMKSTGEDDDKDVVKLLEVLGYIPLAITQAASYIDRRGAFGSAKKYLEIYHKNEQSRQELLQRSEFDLRRYNGMHNSIAGTWEVSFKHIDEKRKSAANLLSLMSHFHWRAIPVFVLRAASKTWERTAHKDPDIEFEEDVAYLLGFGLINDSGGEELLEMHPLAQSLTRDWLRVNARSERWQKDFIEAILQSLTDDPRNIPWKNSEALLPHVEMASGKRPDFDGQLFTWARMLDTAAKITLMKHQYDLAERFYREALAVLDKLMLKDHPTTMGILAGLVKVLHWQRKDMKQVEQLTRRIRDGCKRLRSTDPESETTLSCWDHLYRLFHAAGEDRLAEVHAQWVLHQRRKVYGKYHPNTLANMDVLASIYYTQGRFADSERMGRQVLKGFEETRGLEHPFTLHSMENLGSVFSAQGKDEPAVKLYKRALKGRVKALGEHHPYNLQCAMSLGLLLENLKSLKNQKTAIQMYWRVLEAEQETLGKDDPRTLETAKRLASALRLKRKYQLAEKIRKMEREQREAEEKEMYEKEPEEMEICKKEPEGEEIITADDHSEAEQSRGRLLEKEKIIVLDSHPAGD